MLDHATNGGRSRKEVSVKTNVMLVFVFVFFSAAALGPAQTYGICNNCNCACCDCDGNCLIDGTNCCGISPIIIDVGGDGFVLTSPNDGVDFDFFGRGKKIRMSWTELGAENAWLVLDRNHNGLIDNGTEMFGNITPQPKSADPNGFRALAVYDLPENGGNGDGMIDAKDSIYSSLRLWIDKNHNGISEPDELFTLPSLGVVSINLHYHESKKTDEFGNVFRYRSTIVGATGSLDRVIYDVFLAIGHLNQPSTEASNGAKAR
jgi:hypothetical protein